MSGMYHCGLECVQLITSHTFVYILLPHACMRSKGLSNHVMVECSYFAVDDSMPIEMYGESWIAGLLTSDDVML